MKFPRRLVKAELIKRDTRFSARVLIDGKKETVYVPNTGRLGELLVPGREVWLLPAGETKIPRKTRFTLVMTRFGAGLVSVQAAKANDLFQEAFEEGKIKELGAREIAAREKKIGSSRIDFLLKDDKGNPMWLEVKSVTLVNNGRGMFPDAPTERGTKHLKELIERVENGEEAAVAFIIQREDAESFSSNETMDPLFSETLKKAFEKGVRIIAYRCSIGIDFNYVTEPVPVMLK